MFAWRVSHTIWLWMNRKRTYFCLTSSQAAFRVIMYHRFPSSFKNRPPRSLIHLNSSSFIDARLSCLVCPAADGIWYRLRIFSLCVSTIDASPKRKSRSEGIAYVLCSEGRMSMLRTKEMPAFRRIPNTKWPFITVSLTYRWHPLHGLLLDSDPPASGGSDSPHGLVVASDPLVSGRHFPECFLEQNSSNAIRILNRRGSKCNIVWTQELDLRCGDLFTSCYRISYVPSDAISPQE